MYQAPGQDLHRVGESKRPGVEGFRGVLGFLGRVEGFGDFGGFRVRGVLGGF